MAFRRSILNQLGATFLASAWLLAGATTARAQPIARTDAEPSGLDAVIVTAQAREQKSLDVPLTLTALSQHDLQALRVLDLRDVALRSPGLFVEAESTRAPVIVIRGISIADAEVNTEPRIAVFQDGVSSSRLQQSLFDIFDEERVEVVRGPQPTLFGRSALIGAISVIQNKARLRDTEFSGLAEAGNLGERRFEEVANMPIGSTSAIRVAGRQYHRDGYIDNLATGLPLEEQDNQAYRISLHTQPIHDLTADAILNYQVDEQHGSAYKGGDFFPSNPASGRVLSDRSPYSAAALSPGSGFAFGSNLGGYRTLLDATGLLSWRVSEAATLQAISGYRHFQTRNTDDYDGTSLAIVTSGDATIGDQYSQEFRLQLQPSRRFHALFGISAFKEADERFVPIQIDERLVAGLLTGVIDRRNPVLEPLAAYTAPAVLSQEVQGLVSASGASITPIQAAAIASNLQEAQRQTYTRGNDTTAIDTYSELSYRFSPLLEATIGARFTGERKESGFASTVASRSIIAGLLGALSQPPALRAGLLRALAAPGAAVLPMSALYPVPVFGLGTQLTASGGRDHQTLTDAGGAWKAAIRVSPSRDLSAYASYSRGRRPEVLEAASPTTPLGASRFTQVPSELVDSFELGIKGRLFAGRLELEGALYDYSYRHFQTLFQQGLLFITTDAGRAASYGFEGQARWAPTSFAKFVATYGYSHGRFEGGLYDGNHFQYTPDHTITAGLDLHQTMFGGLVSLRPNLTYRSRLWFDDSNGRASLIQAIVAPIDYKASQGAVALTNINLSYEPPRGGWSVSMFLNNAFDRSYLRGSGAGSLAFGLPTYIAAPPRNFGVSWSLHV